MTSAGPRIDWAGVAGIAGFALPVVGNVFVISIFDFPATDAPAAEIAEFVADQKGRALAGMVIASAGVALWLALGAGVWTRLRQASGGETFGTACFAFGYVAFVTLILAGFTPFTLMAYRDGAGADARLLYDAAFGLLAMSGAPTALALGAYAAVVYRLGALPAWTAVLALIGAVAHVVLLGSFVIETGFFSLQGQVITAIPATLFAWILGTSIALLRAQPSSSS